VTQNQTAYASHGVPLETYQVTRHDRAQQHVAEEISDAVKRQEARWRADEEADPELRARRAKTVQRALEILAFPTPDRDIMTWRVRLYCGHIVETRRHYTIREPRMHGSSSQRCPECGKDPAYIVAYEPLGNHAGPAAGPHAPRLESRKPSRAQLERELQS
jgi:hypothetical protein